jgi:protocatechuate 3,4-dioxygenase beta subunit
MDDITRRQALGAFGAAGAGAVLGVRSLARSSDAEAAACVLTPEQDEGPLSVDLGLLRSDITGDRTGVPLQLRIKIVNATTCRPIRRAAVEVWHTDALGRYSHEAREGTASATWLRGVQRTDGRGMVRFTTIYPGFSQGRATHIDVKVHTRGQVSHTGQLFFPDRLSETVHRLSPYTENANRWPADGEDRVHTSEAGAGSVLRTSRLGPSLRDDGVRAAITLGVNPAASR